MWASVRSSVANMTDALLSVDEGHRAVETRIDGAVVLVHVMQWSTEETRIYVEAKKYMLASPEVSELVMNRIVRDLSR